MRSSDPILVSREGPHPLGEGFERPESIIATADGDVFASHLGAAVRHIAADGRSAVLGRPPPGVTFRANGIELLDDGTLLVANASEDGGVWALGLDGEVRPHLLEADGCRLAHANFVLDDGRGALWTTVSTRRPTSLEAYRLAQGDGFVVRQDARGTRIVGDGLGFANECRVSLDGRSLFVAETAAARVSVFPIGDDGDLGARRTLVEFGEGAYPEGLALDAAGGLWVTTIIEDAVWRIDPAGVATRVLADLDEASIAAAVAARRAGLLAAEHFYARRDGAMPRPTSLAFAGPDLTTLLIGSLSSTGARTVRVSIPGAPRAHHHRRRPFAADAEAHL